MQNRTRDYGGVCTEKLQRHQRTGTVREHVCRSANMLDNGLQVRGLDGEVVASVCSVAALAATAPVVGNDAIVTGELAGDGVKKDAVDAGTVHANQGGCVGRYNRAGILAAGDRSARILDRKIHTVFPSSTPPGRAGVRLGQMASFCVYMNASTVPSSHPFMTGFRKLARLQGFCLNNSAQTRDPHEGRCYA